MSTSMSDDDLLGRKTDLSRIREILRTRSVLLTGARRVGKTELCRTLVRVPRTGWRFLRIDLERVADAPTAAALVESDLDSAGLGRAGLTKALDQVESVQLAGVGASRAGGAAADPWARIEAAVARACRSLPEGQVFVLVLDEVPWWLDSLRARSGDAAAREALAALRHLRQRDELVDRFRMVLTGSIGLAGLARQLGASAEVNDLMPPYELAPLDPAAARTVFELHVAERGFGATPEGAAAVSGMCGGFPHWTKLLAERVRPGTSGRVGETEVREAVAALLSPRLRNQFEDEGVQHLRRRYGPGRARTLSTILTAASNEEGASKHALVAVALSAEQGLTRREAEECVYTLVDEYYLDERPDGNLGFLLPLLREWWLRYGESP